MDQQGDGDCASLSPKHICGARAIFIYIKVHFYGMNFQNSSEKARDFHGVAHIFAKPVLLLQC